MCGIVGMVSHRHVAESLLEGLRRLEYRGYDSAGMAVVDEHNQLQRLRCVGKVEVLAQAMETQHLFGKTGIAHTRWATHGVPAEQNAHPHCSGHFALVHNGIIENHQTLRLALQNKGYQFQSDTDTEVIVHLLEWESRRSANVLEAVQHVVQQLKGAYAIVVMDYLNPTHLIAARSGSPLVIGLGQQENFFASDQLALLHIANQFIFLEEGDVAEITSSQVNIYDSMGQRVQRACHQLDVVAEQAEKGTFSHFMQKEIFEQPTALLNTMQGCFSEREVNIDLIGSEARKLFEQIEHIHIVACGTSYHAGMVARYWFEGIAGVSCDVEIASEFRYRQAVTRPNSLFITLSQSGETADTLAALRIAKQRNYIASMTICNVVGSSLVRESDFAFMTRAGVEIGVASTKAFTTQLVALLMLVIAIGKQKKAICADKEAEMVEALTLLPAEVKKLLALEPAIAAIAQEFAAQEHALFLGRGELYPIMQEAALKLKEISYIHAEAYAAGELKHGPLALVDAAMPVIVAAPNNELVEKVKSNIEEVRARGGHIYLFTDKEAGFTASQQVRVIFLPTTHSLLTPILYTVPMQLFAYHVALVKGTDVDQPRNLAKAVTVE